MVRTEVMKLMTQLNLAEMGFLPKVGKPTRKAVFCRRWTWLFGLPRNGRMFRESLRAFG
jgi:hypothetical protein